MGGEGVPAGTESLKGERYEGAVVDDGCALYVHGGGDRGGRGSFSPSPHVYVTPTVGVWRWDEKAVDGYPLEKRSGLVWGGRAGYSPIEAFSGELVVLTGTNDFRKGAAAFNARLTQVELSFVVNFRSLVNARVYPFLDLGSGVSARRAGAGGDRWTGWTPRTSTSISVGGSRWT